MPRTPKPQFLLFLSLFNSILGLSILFPILAPLGRQLGLSVVQVGWLSTAYSSMQFVGSPYWGRKSEQLGRRPILLIGLFGFAISFASFGAVATLGARGVLSHLPLFAALLTTRVVGGFLSAATMPTAQAYMADITERDQRASGMAFIGAAFGLGVVFGPGIGALLAPLGLLVPVWVSSGIALLNGIFVWRSLPEPKRHQHDASIPPNGALLPRVWSVLLVGFTVTLAAVAMEQTVAFLFQDVLSLSATDTARHVGLGLVGYGICAVFAQGWLVRRFGWTPTTLLKLGIPVTLVGFVILTQASTFPWLTLALALQGLGQGLIGPGISAALSLAVGDREQGKVAGLNSASQALGRTLGPLIGATLYHLHHRAPYKLSLLLLSLVLVVVMTGRGLRQRQPAIS